MFAPRVHLLYCIVLYTSDRSHVGREGTGYVVMSVTPEVANITSLTRAAFMQLVLTRYTFSSIIGVGPFCIGFQVWCMPCTFVFSFSGSQGMCCTTHVVQSLTCYGLCELLCLHAVLFTVTCAEVDTVFD